MKRRFVRSVLAVVATAGALSASSAAQAQEIELTGPLKGAPAVRHMELYREGRFTIAPTFSFTLLDEYRRTILIGATLNYNIKDWLAIGVWGADGLVSMNTSLASEIDNPSTGSQRDALTAINVNHLNSPEGGYAPFTSQTAKMDWVVAPQLTFIPFRGKLAIFNKIFVDSDLYIALGAAFVGIEERGDCGPSSTPCSNPSTFALTNKMKIAPTGAIGFTFYPSDFVSFGVEYRALPFSWNLGGFDSKGTGTNGNFPDGQINSQDDTFVFNQMVSILIGFSLPTAPKISE